MSETVASYRLTVEKSDTSSSLEYKTQRRNCKKLLKSTEGTLKDLQGIVRVIDSDREQFSHIGDEELDGRRRFVEEMGSKMRRIKNELSSGEQLGIFYPSTSNTCPK